MQPKNWIKTGLNISGNYSTSNVAQDGGGLVNPFAFSRYIGPIYPVYSHNMTTGALVLDANGEKIYDLGNFGSTPFGTANGIKNRPSGANGGRHALAEILLDQDIFRRNVVSARSSTDLMFLNNFKFTNNVAVDFHTQSNTAYDNQLVGDGAPGGRSNKSTNSSTGFIASQILGYAQTFESRHRVDALVGHESFNQYDNNLGGFMDSANRVGQQG